MPGPGYAFYDQEEERSVLAVLQALLNSRDTYGKPQLISQARSFEEAAGERLNSPYCLSLNSGTSALLAGLAALGIGPGDEVIVPGFMFIATISTVVHSGATPVFAEIDTSLTLDPQDVRRKITERTRAIVAVHMLGASCDMAALSQIAEENGLYLIEDVAQACGGTYRGAPLGTLGDVGAFSLDTFKVINGGGAGGFLLMKDGRLFQRAYSFHDQGWFPGREETGDGDVIFGLNLRMPEFNAAFARAQLAKLDTVLERTRLVKSQLDKLIPLRPGLEQRRLNDPDGDCATVSVYLFDQPEAAQAVAQELGCSTLDKSRRHYYAQINALSPPPDQEAPTCPFQHKPGEKRRNTLAPGELPRTDNLLSRAVALSVGLSDSYLGSGFGASVRSDPDELSGIADRFSAAAAQALR